MSFERIYSIDYDELVNYPFGEIKWFPPFIHQNCRIILQTFKKDSIRSLLNDDDDVESPENKSIAFSVRIEIPKDYESVVCRFKCHLMNQDGTSKKKKLTSPSPSSYQYDNDSFGSGGFNFRSYVNLKSCSEFLDENRHFKVKLELIEFIINVNKGIILKKIIEVRKPEIFNQRMIAMKSEISEYREQIKSLKKQIAEMQDTKEKQEEPYQTVSEEKKKLVERHEMISEINNRLKQRIVDLQTMFLVINKRIDNHDALNQLLNGRTEKIKNNSFSVDEQIEFLRKCNELMIRCNKNFQEHDLCIICMDNRRTHALNPCGHLSYCEDCINLLNNQGSQLCPTCMAPYQQAVHVKGY